RDQHLCHHPTLSDLPAAHRWWRAGARSGGCGYTRGGGWAEAAKAARQWGRGDERREAGGEEAARRLGRGSQADMSEGGPARGRHRLEVEAFGSAGDHSHNWSSNLPSSIRFLIAVRKRAASAPSMSRWS